eukprot:12430835-Karenia_brevis.AAC.1
MAPKIHRKSEQTVKENDLMNMAPKIRQKSEKAVKKNDQAFVASVVAMLQAHNKEQANSGHQKPKISYNEFQLRCMKAVEILRSEKQLSTAHQSFSSSGGSNPAALSTEVGKIA